MDKDISTIGILIMDDEKKLLKVYQKVDNFIYEDKCLWGNCSSKSILSHSHTKSILKNLTVNNENKIYGLTKNFIRRRKGILFDLYTINKASTFHGFCPSHDNDLFKYIESSELEEIDKKAAFLFFTRGIFFEIFQKKSAILRTEKFKELLDLNNLEYNDSFLYFIKGCKVFLETTSPFYESEIYNITENKKFEKINFLFKKIPKKLEISLSTTINPINIFSDKNFSGKPQPIFSLNIIPYKNHGIILLTWLKQHDNFMEKIKNHF